MAKDKPDKTKWKPTLEDLLKATTKPLEASTDDVLPPGNTLILQDKNLPIDSPLNYVTPDVLAVYTMEQLEVELTQVSFAHAYPVCGHITLDRRRSNGLLICSDAAGDGTDHPGRGRCAKHEFGQSISPRSPYVDYLKQFDSLQMIFERFQNRDKAIKDLSDEMNIARSALAYNCQRLEKDKTKSYKNGELLDKMMMNLEIIRKIAKTMADIQQTEAQGITPESVDAFVWQVQRILDQEIPSPQQKVRIFDRIATECGFLHRA